MVVSWEKNNHKTKMGRIDVDQLSHIYERLIIDGFMYCIASGPWAWGAQSGDCGSSDIEPYVTVILGMHLSEHFDDDASSACLRSCPCFMMMKYFLIGEVGCKV